MQDFVSICNHKIATILIISLFSQQFRNMSFTYYTNKGESLDWLVQQRTVMLVFLRHFGCTFCRESMTELSRQRPAIEERGIKIVLVHMIESKMASEILQLYDLADISHISDPGQRLYKTFGLKRARWKEFFTPRVVWRVFIAGIVKGHLAGKPLGDPYQMPGVFVYHKNSILSKFTHQVVSDRPNYLKLISAQA
jgi:peroxiredoxin